MACGVLGGPSAIKGISLRWLVQKDLYNIIYGTNGSQYSQAKTESEHRILLLDFIHGHPLNSSEFFLVLWERLMAELMINTIVKTMG